MRHRAKPSDDPVAAKLERLRRGGSPTVLDLFAGCGGLSLGFLRAGFRIVGAVEKDPTAAATHARNFHGGARGSAEAPVVAGDLTDMPPERFDGSPRGTGRDPVDVIVGGPPCQAYARIGRAKLREVAAHPEAYRVDPRGDLYMRYLDYVRALQPLALLIENVPDIMNWGGRNLAEEICQTLGTMGYVARYSLLNAARFGVPQMRDRVFIKAIHRRLGTPPCFPLPERWIDLPVGYAGLRRVALRRVDLFASRHFVRESVGTPSLAPAVSAREALGDLPPITEHLRGLMPRGARRFTRRVAYRPEPPSDFAALMRAWPGFEASDGVCDHVIRLLPRDPPIFRRMPPGSEYPRAVRIAEALFDAALARAVRRGGSHGPTPEEVAELRRRIVPPYPVATFPNRWWKLDPDLPARTLTAHLGKDSYSHIHYDGRQARTISVREAARLQSFPDGFRFEGAMNAAFRQIGNAVPPLLAWRLAECLRRTLACAAK